MENRVVVNWMQIEDTGSDIRVRYQEVLKSIGDHITLGSGKAKADRLIAAELTSVDHKLLSVLRKVCLDEDEQTVGGYVQYGRFVGQDFQIVGVQNYRIDDNGLMEFAYTFRGMDVFAKDGKYGTNALVLTGKFVAPFHDEINDTLWGKGNWPPK